MTNAEIAKTIDLAVLKPTDPVDYALAAAEAAVKLGLASVCVRPDYIREVAKVLKGTSVTVGTVIGFPLGYGPTNVKVFETEEAYINGATEFDMVMNIGYFKSSQFGRVEADISRVVQLVSRYDPSCLVKVILETYLLSSDEIALACKLAESAGADYVKTSTGFAEGGATVNAVKIMMDTVGNRLGVKASGGIKTREQAEMFLAMGCKRLGVGSIARILI
jgi:deoxyribose-phosphate aldolase